MDEISLIYKLTNHLKKPDNLLVPIGDDCAFVDTGHGIELFTTDTMVEGVHFDLSFSTAEDLAIKLVSSNLSDIASCGGTPKYALISITVPKHINAAFLEKFYKQLNELTVLYNFGIIGGDVSAGKEFNLTMTVVGRAERVNCLRNNAKAGDVLFCVGELGWAGLGLQVLREKVRIENKKFKHKAVEAFLNPVPLLREGYWLSAHIRRLAMMDSSDGLANCAFWIAKSSNVTVILEPDLAVDTQLKGLTSEAKGLTYDFGDDYALVGTMSEADWASVVSRYPADYARIRKIGTIAPFNKVFVYEKELIKGHIKLSQVNSHGYSHF